MFNTVNSNYFHNDLSIINIVHYEGNLMESTSIPENRLALI
jgi:hypothetical protein